MLGVVCALLSFCSSHNMFEPVRGGTRGGQAEFKWADVSADKDREVGVLGLLFGRVLMSRYRTI